MRLSKIDRKLLVTLFKGNRELDAFTLFRRMKIPFFEFSSSLKSLEAAGLIQERDERISITSIGINTFISNDTLAHEKPWRNVPERYQRTRLMDTEMYVPSLRLLDSRTFENIKNDVE